ncbi:uncharacterized protein LOC130893049 [Diorhabda carinulata]|uniref:uncharacterized protein LOC130893049 n=1 Tax=Diorhabda carinulata TaxID=1163345 RepID=UPI0025A103AE|nr:uncharacterized protein LOC130893049 [Diorhabda carinulata]
MSDTMPRTYTCCVPSCGVKLKIDEFFYFPTNPDTRRSWIAAIPDLYTAIGQKSVICKVHFGVQGQLGFHELNPPHIFPSPKPRVYFPKYMFMLPSRDVVPETFADCDGINIADFILDFSLIRLKYKQKLGVLVRQWQVINSPNTITFYKMKQETIAKIKCSVRINSQLQVEVILGGKKMDPLDLTWVLPPYSKITRWSQLKLLLYEFSTSNETIVYEVNIV